MQCNAIALHCLVELAQSYSKHKCNYGSFRFHRMLIIPKYCSMRLSRTLAICSMRICGWQWLQKQIENTLKEISFFSSFRIISITLMDLSIDYMLYCPPSSLYAVTGSENEPTHTHIRFYLKRFRDNNRLDVHVSCHTMLCSIQHSQTNTSLDKFMSFMLLWGV